MKQSSGQALLKRRVRYTKCIVSFPERADYYRDEIAKIDSELIKIKACQLCGRPLKGEDSQARGYGPECIKKIEGRV